MARALLMSLLSRQYLLLKAAAFRERYPHGWLVWESGVWNVPEAGEELGATRHSSGDITDCLPQSDVLCFELQPPVAPTFLKVGRASENDIVVNDATVSREHLQVGRDGDRWWAQPFAESAGSEINGVPMDAGRKTPLVSGVKLRVGDVTMTYHTPESFLARVNAHAEHLASLGGKSGSPSAGSGQADSSYAETGT